MERTLIHPAVKDFLVSNSDEVSVGKLAKMARCHPRTIQHMIANHQKTGSAVKQRSGNGKEKVLTAPILAVGLLFIHFDYSYLTMS
jgi:hypothetical protein